MLRNDPTGNYAMMAPPIVVMPASAWMCRTMLLAEEGSQNGSVYLNSDMVVILDVLICELILFKLN
jgi:hypothetical protein